MSAQISGLLDAFDQFRDELQEYIREVVREEVSRQREDQEKYTLDFDVKEDFSIPERVETTTDDDDEDAQEAVAPSEPSSSKSNGVNSHEVAQRILKNLAERKHLQNKK